MARIIWTPKALDDLESLLTFIAKESQIAAKRFAQKIIKRVDLLATQPFLGSYISEDDARIYRQIIQGNYRVIYRTDGRMIYLVTIHHAARLLDSENLD
jgi:toxin ParE1/3/4